MAYFSQFNNFSASLPNTPLMPVLFMGHGSPMNGIVENEFNAKWKEIAAEIPRPSAVLVISAHWYTRGTRVSAVEFPETIHDFGGFPQELFDVQYPAPGFPELALDTVKMVTQTPISLDHEWGLDHGAWTIIRHMYPNADIPVLQLSIDYSKSPREHVELSKALYQLRNKGVLIIGSGNMVHNLRMINWGMINGGGYDWAHEINEQFKTAILNHDLHTLVNYDKLGVAAQLAIPTAEHYLPLLYTLGLQQEKDQVQIFNDKLIGGSLTMTSVWLG